MTGCLSGLGALALLESTVAPAAALLPEIFSISAEALALGTLSLRIRFDMMRGRSLGDEVEGGLVVVEQLSQFKR